MATQANPYNADKKGLGRRSGIINSHTVISIGEPMRWLNLQAQGPYRMTSAEYNEMRVKLLAMGKRRFEVGEWYRFNKDSLYLYVVSSHAP